LGYSRLKPYAVLGVAEIASIPCMNFASPKLYIRPLSDWGIYFSRFPDEFLKKNVPIIDIVRFKVNVLKRLSMRAHSQKVGSSFQKSLTAWSFNSRRLGNLDITSYFLGMRFSMIRFFMTLLPYFSVRFGS
jgi:hypothetical protein